jgi:hypothetical protein
MRIVPICPLVTAVELDVARNIIRVTAQGQKKVFDAYGSTLPLTGSHPEASFETILTCQDPVAVVRVGVDHHEISSDLLALLAQGNPLTVPLDDLSARDPNGKQWSLTLLYLLPSTGETQLLGIIETQEKALLTNDERLVAVLDILGFSQLLNTLSLDELENKLQDVFKAVAFAELFAKDVLLMTPTEELANVPELQQLAVAIISDTIVIYGRSNQPLLRTIVEAVAYLMDATAQLGWLLRGAIDVDTFRAIDAHHMFIGRALATAYKLERAQNWSGCILSENILTRFPKDVEELTASGLVVRYDVPMKSSDAIIHQPQLAVNWTNMTNVHLHDRLTALHTLLENAPPSAKNKVQETIQFVETMQRQGLTAVRAKTATISYLGARAAPETNGVVPIRMLVFEDCAGSAQRVIDHLTALNIGVVLVRSIDRAKAALAQYDSIRLYVADHHIPESGLVSIAAVIFERDVLKKEFKGIPSALLTDNPHARSSDEGVAFGFKQAGGDYVIDCRQRSAQAIASELVNLLADKSSRGK